MKADAASCRKAKIIGWGEVGVRYVPTEFFPVLPTNPAGPAALHPMASGGRLFRDRLRIDGFVDRGAIIIGTLKVQIISQPSKCCSTETRDQIIHNDCSEHAAALQQDQPTVDNKHLSVMQFYQYGNDGCQVM